MQYEITQIPSIMKKNILISHICTHFAGMVAGDDSYDDFFSLQEALHIAIQKLPDDIEKEDLRGWKNPHLDYMFEEWKSYE